MLRGDKIAAHVPGEFYGSLEDAFSANGEGNIGGRGGLGGGRRWVGLDGPDGTDGFPGAVDGDAGPEEATGGAVLSDEPEEEVLSEDHLLAKGPGFALGEHHGLDGTLGEALEYGRDLGRAAVVVAARTGERARGKDGK